MIAASHPAVMLHRPRNASSTGSGGEWQYGGRGGPSSSTLQTQLDALISHHEATIKEPPLAAREPNDSAVTRRNARTMTSPQIVTRGQTSDAFGGSDDRSRASSHAASASAGDMSRHVRAAAASAAQADASHGDVADGKDVPSLGGDDEENDNDNDEHGDNDATELTAGDTSAKLSTAAGSGGNGGTSTVAKPKPALPRSKSLSDVSDALTASPRTRLASVDSGASATPVQPRGSSIAAAPASAGAPVSHPGMVAATLGLAYVATQLTSAFTASPDAHTSPYHRARSRPSRGVGAMPAAYRVR